MKKVVFILPGFFCSTTEYGYQAIGSNLTSIGFKVVYVEIVWKYKSLTDYLEQFQVIYLKEKGEVNMFFGFSYGAMVAYLSAPYLKPDFLYLCSMAPYFTEDSKYIPSDDKKEIGKKRTADIEKYSFNSVAKKITSHVTVFFGENEQMFVKRRVRLAKEKLKNMTIVKIPSVGHCISDDRYIKSVQKEVKKLSSIIFYPSRRSGSSQ